VTFAVLTGVLVASLAGSVHCLAMCGPLIGLHGGIKTARLALMHSLGRLATYVTLGLIAGAIGKAVDLAGRLGNVQRAATIIAGLVIIAWGVWSLAVARGWLDSKRRFGGARFASGLAHIRAKPPRMRAWLTGVLTGLLPCGWLWAFVVMAAGTGSLAGGGLVMLAFWLGTVPAMVGLLTFAGPTLARIRARLPALTAIALIVMGLGTLAYRWRDAGAGQVTAPHCHCHDGANS
jgi:sulfite exporter TauE/SafE